MGIYRDNLLAIVIGNNLLPIPIIVIAQNSLELTLATIFIKSLFVLFNATAEFANCFLFLKMYKNIFAFRFKKKTSSNTLKMHRNIYWKNLLAIIYRLLISL